MEFLELSPVLIKIRRAPCPARISRSIVANLDACLLPSAIGPAILRVHSVPSPKSNLDFVLSLTWVIILIENFFSFSLGSKWTSWLERLLFKLLKATILSSCLRHAYIIYYRYSYQTSPTQPTGLGNLNWDPLLNCRSSQHKLFKNWGRSILINMGIRLKQIL